jgi:hypothetical protein
MAFPDDSLDNSQGTIAELSLEVGKVPTSRHNALVLCIQDGIREARLIFYENKIELCDGDDPKAVYELNTTRRFRTYRLALHKDAASVSVDGRQVASTTVSGQTDKKRVLFGDTSKEEGENFKAKIRYLAYANAHPQP